MPTNHVVVCWAWSENSAPDICRKFASEAEARGFAAGYVAGAAPYAGDGAVAVLQGSEQWGEDPRRDWDEAERQATAPDLKLQSIRDAFTYLPARSKRQPGEEFTQPPEHFWYDLDVLLLRHRRMLESYAARYGKFGFPHQGFKVIWQCDDLGEVEGKPGRRLRLVRKVET